MSNPINMLDALAKVLEELNIEIETPDAHHARLNQIGKLLMAPCNKKPKILAHASIMADLSVIVSTTLACLFPKQADQQEVLNLMHLEILEAIADPKWRQAVEEGHRLMSIKAGRANG